MKYLLSVLLFTVVINSLLAQSTATIKIFDAPHARQAVCADSSFFYVIDNATIIKRDRKEGLEIKSWSDDRLHHLNSGFIKDSLLYCAHSNYPQIPMHSSIEIWNTHTLEHVGTHSFGIENGSCTWVVEKDNFYYVMFAHYNNEGKKQKNRDVSWTQLIKYDKEWRRVAGWVLPKDLIDKVSPYSISGGILLEDGRLLCTHHHFKELYILSFPEMGSELIYEATISTEIRGQGIYLDTDGYLWGIDKKERKVIQTLLPQLL
ncbi:hypothetical protein EI427_03660 [Flammeovirga pectinis]|uniref:Endonuclease n=1 Tax=Flammeovirga pectinis TaxID=2494373 RepID=A0A3Q9FM45_9BACT|nr:hypothetical protein [Flammeovirga pectinis]AZQ61350.1 hypothetical protein EI427_03660 [Flammeovirga pectinis]